MVRHPLLHFQNSDSNSGKLLNCNVHTCPHRCHQLQDHSKMDCKAIVSSMCPKNHKITRKCHDKASTTCRKCEAEARAQEKKRLRDYKLDEERQAKQQAYAARLVEIEDEIEHQKRILKDQRDAEDRDQALAQKKQDLLNLKTKAREKERAKAKEASIPPPTKTTQTTSNNTTPSRNGSTPAATPSNDSAANDTGSGPKQNDSQPEWDESEAKDDWEWQKQYEGATNEALDSLISMIGEFDLLSLFLLVTRYRS